MENKVLIKLNLPEINMSFDVFIPINEIVWKTKKMLIKCVNDIVNTNFDLEREYSLINRDNGRMYSNNELIIDTDIRNYTELLIVLI